MAIINRTCARAVGLTGDALDAQNKAIAFIQKVTTASKLGSVPTDPDVLAVLKTTVVEHGYLLYRGLCFTPDPEQAAQFKQLKVGSKAEPDLLYSPSSTVSHCSKSLQAAQEYADKGDGSMHLLLRFHVGAEHVVADLTKLDRMLDVPTIDRNFNEADKAYLEHTEEVLVYRDRGIIPQVISITFD